MAYKKHILKPGYCVSCVTAKITKHGLFCDICALPYEGIIGDNEAKDLGV